MKSWKAEVELELQEIVTRQDDFKPGSMKGLAGTQGGAVLENASRSEVQESLVLCDPQRSAEKAQNNPGLARTG